MTVGYHRHAQVAEQINLEAGGTLFEDGEVGHAAYFIMRGVMHLHILGMEQGETDTGFRGFT